MFEKVSWRGSEIGLGHLQGKSVLQTAEFYFKRHGASRPVNHEPEGLRLSANNLPELSPFWVVCD